MELRRAKVVSVVAAAAVVVVNVACGATAPAPKWLTRDAARMIRQAWPAVRLAHVRYRVAPDYALAIYSGRFLCQACSHPAGAQPIEYRFVVLDFARPSHDLIVAIPCNDFSVCRARFRPLGVGL